MRSLTELGNVRIIRELGRVELAQAKPIISVPELGLGLGGGLLIGIGAALEGKWAAAFIGIGASMMATTIFSVVMSRQRE